MDSSPPATASATSPARIWSAAIMMAFMPEPHILLMVVVGTPVGMPAPSAAWRAGAWPSPAGSTQPMMTSCTSLPETTAASSAPLMAAAPSCGAVTGESTPWKAPMGVRLAATMTTCRSELGVLSMKVLRRSRHAGRDACPWSITASKAVIEHIYESVRDLQRLEGRVIAIPVAHPVERARQRERGHARVAAADGAVGDAGLDERAHALVDARLE